MHGGGNVKRQTNLAQAIDMAADKARYDECAKKLLSYKAVLAWILKSCIKEFSQYSVQFICENCLKGKAEISQHAVHQDEKSTDDLDGDTRIEGLNTEAGSMKERTVYFDIRFKALLPGSNELVQLIVNLEIQVDDTPGYPLVTRGFYYCARMISEQYGTVFTGEDYGKLQKVYSIWICPNPAKKRKNGIFRYHTIEDKIMGESGVHSEAYDLMEVIVLHLGNAEEESGNEILNLLNVLFSSSLSSNEKKRRLHKDFHIAMTAELESEVKNMCNLSQALIEQGVEQGIQKEKLSLAKMMIQEGESIEKIKKYTGYPIEKIKEIAETIKKVADRE